jgi:DNA-binding transcriptional LysR family regulator
MYERPVLVGAVSGSRGGASPTPECPRHGIGHCLGESSVAQELTPITVFAKVVETKSFTVAARQLGLSKATVSKQVATLEKRLGARLLVRTTRSLSLTEIGAKFYTRCRYIVSELETAEDEVTQFRTEPRGTLRINAPVSFGAHYLAREVCDFLRLYPSIQVDLALSDRAVGLTEEYFDLAIRITREAPANLQSKLLAPCVHLVCGAPGYLRDHGTPQRAEDLADHDCLTYAYLATGNTWHLDGPHGTVPVMVSGSLRANNGEALRHALLSGLGVGLMPWFLVANDLAAGRLLDVLPGYRNRSYSIYAVYPDPGPLLPKVRVFVNFLQMRSGRWPTDEFSGTRALAV